MRASFETEIGTTRRDQHLCLKIQHLFFTYFHRNKPLLSLSFPPTTLHSLCVSTKKVKNSVTSKSSSPSHVTVIHCSTLQCKHADTHTLMLHMKFKNEQDQKFNKLSTQLDPHGPSSASISHYFIFFLFSFFIFIIMIIVIIITSLLLTHLAS